MRPSHPRRDLFHRALFRRALAAALLVLGLTPPLRSDALPSTPEQRGDDAFRRRAAGFVDSGRLDPQIAAAAVASYDADEGRALPRRATEISRRDPRNPLFLAEALIDEGSPASREEALALLRDVARRRPETGQVVEQTETIERARELLAELEGRS